MQSRWPQLIVFDLDFTLWDCGGTWCDCLSPPFKGSGDHVYDSRDYHIRIYPDIPELINVLESNGVVLAIASRTHEPSWARELLALLGLTKTFTYQAIYPSDKQRHFHELQEESGVAFEEMIFFDDEDRNIVSVSKLGVHAHLVHRGVSKGHLDEALQRWRGCEVGRYD